jgi:uncharacterized protein (DUF2336 family)
MLVKRFLTWIQTAPGDARADATNTLARTWLGQELGEFERIDAAAALTLMLDDPEIRVRQALAGVFADAPEAPRHIVLALAADVPEVAAPVLRLSPLLADADLVEWVATRGVAVQCAIARRSMLGAPVSAAIAEVGEAEAVSALLRNPEAAIAEFSQTRIVERFGSDQRIAQALLERGELGAVARFLLAAQCDSAGGASRDGPSRVAQERAAVAVASEIRDDELAAFAAELRRRGLLTATLLLRAIAAGHADLFETVLAELSGLPRQRVAAIAAERRGAGFPALCRKVGLPAALVSVFRAALAVVADVRAARADGLGHLYSPSWIVGRIMESPALRGFAEDHPLVHVFQVIAADFARDEARRMALALAPPLVRRDEPFLPEPLLLDASMAVQGPAHVALVQDNAPVPGGVADAPAGPPSYASMAALLEDTVAAALANLPPPTPRRDERETGRRSMVIEGEWVGVAVDQGFDPETFRADIAA